MISERIYIMKKKLIYNTSKIILGLPFLASLLIYSCHPKDNSGSKLLGVTGSAKAEIDLATTAGVNLAQAEWRYKDVEIKRVDFKAADSEGQPTGKTIKTYDYSPQAGGTDFNDSNWEVLDPSSLNKRRSNGRICFNWYRIKVTIPNTINGYDPTGSTVVFETAIDDYAEIWVNGELPRRVGQSGGSVVGGFNAPNRLVVGRNVQPGQKIQVAVFGINGPISGRPTNFIWMRYAKLSFHQGTKQPLAILPTEVNVEVVRLDPAIDKLVPANAKVFKLAEGFQFTEGPVWVNKDSGYLLFSDPNTNMIYKYIPKGEGSLVVFREKSGYAGSDIAKYGQPGSNGLAIDSQGRLTINEHGNHRVSRLESNGELSILASSYEGKRLNSPNDLVYKSDGSLYFTDPPFGLPNFYNDRRRELSFYGVYRFYKSKLQVLSKQLMGPNGLAFSPDEKYLYVTNWDTRKKVVMRYAVKRDGTLAAGQVFFDMTKESGEIALDGVKVDEAGNLYVSGPKGIWVISAQGKHIGLIRCPQLAANFAWGGDDYRTLYITARNGLYRMPLKIKGSVTRFK